MLIWLYTISLDISPHMLVGAHAADLKNFFFKLSSLRSRWIMLNFPVPFCAACKAPECEEWLLVIFLEWFQLICFCDLCSLPILILAIRANLVVWIGSLSFFKFGFVYVIFWWILDMFEFVCFYIVLADVRADDTQIIEMTTTWITLMEQIWIVFLVADWAIDHDSLHGCNCQLV